MHQITFFPLGNADCCLVELSNGRTLLFDYPAMRNMSDPDDKRIDLPNALRGILAKKEKDYFDVVAFTHGDMDHIKGSDQFFELQQARKYQGEGRIKIKQLWVPAVMILEDGADDELRVLRQEARHRLIAGAGVRVFSRPTPLAAWLSSKSIEPSTRSGLIYDAGTLIPDFNLDTDGLEIFIHAPYAWRVEDGLLDRNLAPLILQMVFKVGEQTTRFMMIGDCHASTLDEVVTITTRKGRAVRLEWDIYDIPHHCSWRAVGIERGDQRTTPTNGVSKLMERGSKRSLLIASSKPIPETGDETLPPHRQAASYYKSISDEKEGRFLVTMEHPTKDSPTPLVISIDENGPLVRLRQSTTTPPAITRNPPWAG